MRKKPLGPQSYGEWAEALSHPLTPGTALYLRSGSLKEEELKISLFNRISDYVVEEFNKSAAAVKAAEGRELVYCLEGLCTKLSLCLFFRELKFLSPAHREALFASLSRATEAIVSAEGEVGDADVAFALSRLRRIIGVKV